MKKSWEVIGIQWEVIRGLCKVMEGHGRSMRGSWSSVEGQGGYISRSEILRKKIINKNTKCPIDAHCHRHCRRDPRITKF